MSIYDTIALANRRWPELTFKKKNDNEAYSPDCPFCGPGDDRYLIFADSVRYWCRSCHSNGKIISDAFEERLSRVEIEVIQQKAEIARIRKQQEEQEQRLKSIETMLNCTAHITYHETMPDCGREYWHSQGITDKSIERWKLGYTQHVPLWKSKAGYSIPIINNQRLKSIRYRLAIDKEEEKKIPKYLPHVKFLPLTLFNGDRLIKPQDRSMIILSEGEKKTIVSEQNDFPTVGILGKNAFDKRWVKWFMQFETVYVCLDSDVKERAIKLAKMFGNRSRLVELPGIGKLDDCFNDGMSPGDFCEYLRKAKEV